MVKKICIVICFLIMAVLSHAQNIASLGGSVNVFSRDVAFYLYIDNVLYNQQANTKVRVENLNRPNYNLRIEFVNQSRSPDIIQSIRTINEDSEFLDLTYAVSKNRNRANSGLVLYAMLPSRPILPDLLGFETYTFERPKHPINVSETIFYENEIPMMTPQEFDSFLKSLKVEGFDKDRVSITAIVTREVAFSVEQIRIVMKHFSFDDGKLQFAKQAYHHCIDRRNYTNLTGELAFHSNKEELLNYIRQNQ